MCVGFIVWQHGLAPELLLLVAFNRDEELSRPARQSHFWPDKPGLLGGKDLRSGGTWLCITTAGRVAFVTNIRLLADSQREWPKSRGQLPLEFCCASTSARQFMHAIPGEAYPGFNLVAADLAGAAPTLSLLSNRGCPGSSGGKGAAASEAGQAALHMHELPPGVHGIANAPAAQPATEQAQQGSASGSLAPGPWGCQAAKIERGKAALRGLLEGGAFGRRGEAVPWEQLFLLLSDERQCTEGASATGQATGFGHEFEAAASSIFAPPYQAGWGTLGTCCQTVLAVWRDGRAELRERSRAEDGRWRHVAHACLLSTPTQEQRPLAKL